MIWWIIAALLIPVFVGACTLLSLPLEYITPCFFLLVALAFITPFRMKKAGLVGKILMILCGIAALALVLFGV